MTTGDRLSVFEYADAPTFLRDTLESIKKTRPRYSIRAWSIKLKYSNPTSLARTLSENRKIPTQMIHPICESLSLSPKEKAYFELIALGRDKFSAESFEILRETFLSTL